VARNHQSHQSNKKGIFYADIRHNPLGIFLTLYDKKVIEENPHFKDKTYNEVLNVDEARELMRKAVSIILYGDKAVELGVSEKFIHPDAVSIQHNVKVAIYIETRRL